MIGVVVVGHGGGEAWTAPVMANLEGVDAGMPLEVAFLVGEGAQRYPFETAVRRLRERNAHRVVVVPLMVSSHSGHYQQVRALARAAGAHVVTAALDDSPELAEIVTDRARHLLAPGRTADRAVCLVGHGPNGGEDHAAWMSHLRRVADAVAAAGPFGDVRAGLVRDDAPPAVRREAVLALRDVVGLQHRATGAPVAVVPVLVSRGSLASTRIPRDLEGLTIAYDGETIVPHEAVGRWVARRAREAVSARRPAS